MTEVAGRAGGPAGLFKPRESLCRADREDPRLCAGLQFSENPACLRAPFSTVAEHCRFFIGCGLELGLSLNVLAIGLQQTTARFSEFSCLVSAGWAGLLASPGLLSLAASAGGLTGTAEPVEWLGPSQTAEHSTARQGEAAAPPTAGAESYPGSLLLHAGARMLGQGQGW